MDWHCITDTEYICGLKEGNVLITKTFFYELCRYTLSEIRLKIFHNEVEYNEMVNELYLYLSRNGWTRMDTFSGRDGCSLRSWMTKLSWRFFICKKEKMTRNESIALERIDVADVTEEGPDISETIRQMPNRRYAQVLEWMFLCDMRPEEVATRLKTSAANVYNIKHRAILQFLEVMKGQSHPPY